MLTIICGSNPARINKGICNAETQVQMKAGPLILFVFCSALNLLVFGQASLEDNQREKEAKEIAYITDCLKMNRKADGLIEWGQELASNSVTCNSSDSNKSERRCITFEKKSRLAFFLFAENEAGQFLQEISYQRSSYQITIFENDTPSGYGITDETRFGVWMSEDKLSIYFFMINPDDTFVWVLSNGTTVYTP